jgi:hypothetical protein
VACALMAGLRVDHREQNCAPIEIEVLELNPHELPDPAAKFVNHPKDQFVAVILNGIEEFL